MEGLRRSVGGDLNLDESEYATPEGQSIRLDRVAKVRKKLLDWECFLLLKDGVVSGPGMEMPRTPAVFEEKVKWSLEDPDDEMSNEAGNYGTVKDHGGGGAGGLRGGGEDGLDGGGPGRCGEGAVRVQAVRRRPRGYTGNGEDPGTPRRQEGRPGEQPYQGTGPGPFPRA